MTHEHLATGYAPLSQSMTDTEEEDENHGHLNRGESETTEMIGRNMLCKNGRYYPLDETQNLANRYRNERNNLNFCSDDIPIMVIDDASNDLWKRNDITPLRRLCSVIAILVCTLMIVIFVYGLPCDDSVICPRAKAPKLFVPWSQTLEGIELHGPISIVPGVPYNFIFLLRGQQYADEHSKVTNWEQIPVNGGGVLSMKGNSDTPLWWVILKRLPTDINCADLDTDGSGKADCLVAGEQGLLASIEQTAGTIVWVSTLNTYSKLPILLPDLNGDGINDLLSVENGSSLNLVLLSGNNGQLLFRQNTPCQSVELQNLDFNTTVSYLCSDTEGKQSTQLFPLSQLVDAINSSLKQQKLFLHLHDNSHASLSHQITEDDWQLTPNYQLHVQNLGICPGENCQVIVNLTQRHVYNESRSIWDYVSPNSYASKPAIINTTGQPYSAGFALKFWSWINQNVSSKNSLPDDVVKQTWTERVLIFYTNYTEVRERNASQSKVVQLCRGLENCQPNFKLQRNSIAIVDLNDDGSLDLINYKTSYNLNETKSLLSEVQVIELDILL